MSSLILAKNMLDYGSGSYHDDYVNELLTQLKDIHIYGEGYDFYNESDSFDDVLRKFDIRIEKLQYIFIMTSWDDDKSLYNVDPHPQINLKGVTSPLKVYFINKEYKKLPLRIKYIHDNEINIVYSFNINFVNSQNSPLFKYIPFGVSDSIKKIQINSDQKVYDFGFTGGLHLGHLRDRYELKKVLFNENRINFKSNLNFFGSINKKILMSKFKKFKIYWAEFGSKKFLFFDVLKSGKEYHKFLSNFKFFFNTKSADGILNSRFYELLALGVPIICPNDDYGGLLTNGHNSIMYKREDEIYEILNLLTENDNYYFELRNNAINSIKDYFISSIVRNILIEIENLRSSNGK